MTKKKGRKNFFRELKGTFKDFLSENIFSKNFCPPNICDPNFCPPNIYDKSTPCQYLSPIFEALYIRRLIQPNEEATKGPLLPPPIGPLSPSLLPTTSTATTASTTTTATTNNNTSIPIPVLTQFININRNLKENISIKHLKQSL